MTKQEVYLTNIIRAKRCESLGRHRDEFVVRRLDKYPIRSMCFSSKFIMNFGIAVHSFSTLPILLRLGYYRSQMSNMKEKRKISKRWVCAVSISKIITKTIHMSSRLL